MRQWCCFLFLLGAALKGEGPKLPAFSAFPAKSVYTGPVHPIALSKDKYERQFRTRLREGMKQGVNFAGEFTIISWGCGTSCVENAIVNAKTGRVCAWFESCGDDHFRKDSRLLLLNPPDPKDQDPSRLCTPEALVWDGQKLREIAF